MQRSFDARRGTDHLVGATREEMGAELIQFSGGDPSCDHDDALAM
jgi:hypothetical protein